MFIDDADRFVDRTRSEGDGLKVQMKSTFVDYVVSDLLVDVEGVRARAMFGGYGVYQNDTMFAIIVEDELFYKVGDANRRDFEKLGSRPFQYLAKGKKRVTMSYWNVPGEVMDDREQLMEWTDKALDVAKTNKISSKRNE